MLTVAQMGMMAIEIETAGQDPRCILHIELIDEGAGIVVDQAKPMPLVSHMSASLRPRCSMPNLASC